MTTDTTTNVHRINAQNTPIDDVSKLEASDRPSDRPSDDPSNCPLSCIELVRLEIADFIQRFIAKYQAEEQSVGDKSQLYITTREEITPLLEQPRQQAHGDLALPCFVFAKRLQSSPQEIARQLADFISVEQKETNSLVKSAAALGPFLNFHVKREPLITEVLGNIFSEDTSMANPRHKKRQGETILVEYSSPNIAKPFHVGHLRATLIGNSLDRIYRYAGYNTISINHLGDWGTQFGFVWAGCKLWGTPDSPDVLQLVELYRKATGMKAEQETESGNPDESLPNVNQIARDFFVDLEAQKPYAVEFWRWCVDISLTYLHKTYKRLGVSFDHYTGESFYSDKLAAIEAELEKNNLLVESQGARGVDLGDDLGFARVYTPDGRSLYLTRDLATAVYRAQTYNFAKAIYVVGAPQTLHFKQLKAILSRLGHSYSEHMIHVAFGHVLGMKTRGGGEFVELNDFLDDAIDRALVSYREQVSKRPSGLDELEVARKVSLAAIVFSNLSKTRLKDVVFNWKHALELQGDTGPYLLYAYARINGIRDKAAEQGLVFSGRYESHLLTDNYSFALVQQLADFERCLERTIAENEPNFLAEYALLLAKQISKSYQELKVIGVEKELALSRLALFEAARLRLKLSLELLGIEALERM